MNDQDWKELKIDQEIYHNGVLVIIDMIRRRPSDRKITLSFFEDTEFYVWEKIYKDCSLTPPLPKKKYWQWLIHSRNGDFVTPWLYNEDGYTTKGVSFEDDHGSEWETVTKERHGDFVWEE